jgi:hypothetical protein
LFTCRVNQEPAEAALISVQATAGRDSDGPGVADQRLQLARGQLAGSLSIAGSVVRLGCVIPLEAPGYTAEPDGVAVGHLDVAGLCHGGRRREECGEGNGGETGQGFNTAMIMNGPPRPRPLRE